MSIVSLESRDEKNISNAIANFLPLPEGNFEKTLDNIVLGSATLLYEDWLPLCNGFAVSATI